jgi:hypothetical protein
MTVRLSGTALGLAALALALAVPLPVQGRQQQSSGGTPVAPCAESRAAATDALHDLSPVGTRPVRLGTDRAFVLFRMGRTKEAQVSLASALTLLDLTRGRLMTSAERERVHAAIGDLRHCLATSAAPALARLTVRAYEQDDRVPDGRGAAASGALVRIDGMPVGRTRAGGIFTGRVPSGLVLVSAEIPPSEAGWAEVTLAPRGAGAVSIRLESSKDVTEETPLVIAEAKGGLLSAASRALTLRFIAPKGTVHIETIGEIDLLGPDGNSEAALTPMFRVAGGAIVALDAGKVIASMRARRAGPLVLLLEAYDRQGVIHPSLVEFRIE